MGKSFLTILILIALSSSSNAEETASSYWDNFTKQVSLDTIKNTLNNSVDSVIKKSKEGWDSLDVNMSHLDSNISNLTKQGQESLKNFELNLSQLDNQAFDLAQKIDIDKQESTLINKIQTTFPNYDTSTATLSIGAGSDLIRAVTISDKQMTLIADSAISNSDKNHTLASKESSYSQRLIKLNTQLDIQVYIDKNISAFATQNGSIRINSGLMDILNDDELLFIIGHELGHIKHKHSKNNYRITYALSGLKKGAKANGGITGYLAKNGLGLLSDYLVKEQFSEEEEREADTYALSFLKINNRKETIAMNTLKKLKEHSSNMLLTHPLYPNRIKSLKQ